MNIIAVTGHRPDKLGGHGWDVFARLTRFAREIIREQKPEEVISGMALGWDMAVAIATIQLRDEEHLNIRLRCAVPFSTQYSTWRDEKALFIYTKILCKADDVVLLQRGRPADKWAAGQWLNKRNHYMIDEASRLLALWNGTQGGTRNAVYYAMEHACPTLNVWDQWQTFQR